MALKRYTASADTTIANAYRPDLSTRATGANMGASDVLDVFSIYGRYSTSSAELSRALVQFPITDISTDRTSDLIPASGSVNFYLRMFNASHTKTVPKDAKYVFMMVSQSWQEGVGLDMESYKDLTLGNEGSNWMTASSGGNTGAQATLTALSKTAGQANTRVLTILDADDNSVSFTIDNTISTSTATKIAFANAAENATQFATNIAAAINAADDAGTLNITATSSGAVVTLTMNHATLNQQSTNFAGTAISDSVITATTQFGAATVNYWSDICGTLLAGGSYHTYSAGSNKQVDTPIYIFDQTLADGTEDVEIDITPWVEQWIAGTYSNYGIGIMLTSSQEASGAIDYLAGKVSGRADDDGLIQNPSGSTTSYYIKRFFGRKSQYFFKRPYIEARWDDTLRDDRGNFYYSSSVASPADNLNTIYLYNYVRGQLKDIVGIEKTGSVMVSLFSGNVDDTAPTGSSGALLINSQSTAGTTDGANVTLQYFATGGWVSTGIYSASIAITASELATGFDPILTLYDVWSSGSLEDGKHLKRRFHTGSIKPILQDTLNTIQTERNYLAITNLRNSYRADETARFNLFVRQKNWSPNIHTKAISKVETNTIHSASYRVFRTLDNYRAVDYGTGSDNHTYLSYDVSGNYFNFDMTLLEPGYEYAFAFSFYDNSLSSWVEQNQTFRFRVEKL
tara:strand:+ start:21632 stop:23683 length:2052 start_codon:yes stop_codon:yes gene_type:complete